MKKAWLVSFWSWFFVLFQLACRPTKTSAAYQSLLTCRGNGEIRFYTQQELVSFLPFSNGIKERLLQVPLSYRFALRAAPPGCSLAAPTQVFELQLLQDVNISRVATEDRRRHRHLGVKKGRCHLTNNGRGFRGPDGDTVTIGNRPNPENPCPHCRRLDTNTSSNTQQELNTAAYSPEIGGLVAIPASANVDGAYYECCSQLQQEYFTDPTTQAVEVKAAIQEAILKTPEPTNSPTNAPSAIPSFVPTDTHEPSSVPSIAPSHTHAPSTIPSGSPTYTQAPSAVPSDSPTDTQSPSESPTETASTAPSVSPTDTPGTYEFRICFQEIEGSFGQCQGSRNTCSAWSGDTTDGVAESMWTSPYRDDTDDRPGGCQYQWRVDQRELNQVYNSTQKYRVCFRETEGSGPQCHLDRNSCSEWTDASVEDPEWTNVFSDDTDWHSGGCTYQWVIEQKALPSNKSSPVQECRVCFKETQGGGQCQGARNTCSGWSTAPEFSEPFRDHTDGRDGRCNYQWRLLCR